MTRFKTSGWPHLKAMDALFPSNLARGSRMYEPALAVAARCAPSVSTNISAGPSGASNFSSTLHISPVSMSPTFPSGTLLHASPSRAPSHTSPGSVSGATSGTPGTSGNIPELSPFDYAGHSSSSHTSSNPLMTPSTSPANLRYPIPFIGSSTGTVAQGELSEKAFPHNVAQQPQMSPSQFHSFHSSMPLPLAYHTSSNNSPALSMAGSTQSKKCSLANSVGASPGGQDSSAQAALEHLSLNQGERSTKRTKKEQVTPAMIVGVQGGLQYVGSAIASSSIVAAEQRRSERIYSALEAIASRDPDLPDEVKVGMMEAFRKDPSTIDIYLMTPDKSLCWHWIKMCLANLSLVPTDYELSFPQA